MYIDSQNSFTVSFVANLCLQLSGVFHLTLTVLQKSKI